MGKKIMIGVEKNRLKTTENITKTKSLIFEKINKIDI